MRQLVAICLFLTFSISSFGQENNTLLEEIIENIAEENEEELDYSELYEALYYFAEHPINLNKTSKRNYGNYIF